jgi:tripartite-type tricarboxylate transporter receptor subunit TctC
MKHIVSAALRWARSLNFAMVIVLSGAVIAPIASAQTWPDMPIRLIVTTPAGGPIDSFARLLGQGAAKILKQPVIIENKPGASGAIALGHVVKQPADGYTILITANAAFTLVPILRKVPYKPIDDFTFVGQLLYAPDVFVVSGALPAKNMKEFVDLAKARPGKLNYGSMAGIPQHLDFERFKKESATDILFVPYAGGAPILNALISGEIDATLFNAPLVTPWIASGKVRALATSSTIRAASMPDVPTLSEAGFPGINLFGGSFYSLAAPRGLPGEIAQKLFQAFSAAAAETRRARP